MRVAKARVDAIGRYDEVVAFPFGIAGIAFSFEKEGNSELPRAVLQNFEQALAADSDETVAAGGDRCPMDVDVDVVPMRELFGDGSRRSRIVARNVVHREVRENDAPAEGDAGRIALEHLD